MTYWDNIPNIAKYHDNHMGNGYNLEFYSDVGCVVQPNRFDRKDAIFTSWNSKSDGTGIEYMINSTIHTDKDIDLYAQWETGIIMQYKDDNGDLKTVKFTKEQVGDVLQVRDPLFPQLLEPYKSYAKTPDRIIQFIDGEGVIPSVGEMCFYQFLNLKNVILPNAITTSTYPFAYDSNLENVNMKNLTGISNGTFAYTSKLTYINIDSSSHYTISNIKNRFDPEYKEGQIIVPNSFETNGQPSFFVTPITKIDRDDILVIPGWMLSSCPNLNNVIVPNLKNVTQTSTFHPNLENIEIDNATLKSIRNGFNDTLNKTAITSSDGKKLYKILPHETHFKNNDIIDVQFNFLDSSLTRLTYISIENDKLTTTNIGNGIPDNKLLMSKDKTILYQVLPDTRFATTSITSETFPTLTTLSPWAFFGMKYVTEINLPNVTSILGNNLYQLTRSSGIRKIVLENLEMDNINLGDSFEQGEIRIPKLKNISSNGFQRS